MTESQSFVYHGAEKQAVKSFNEYYLVDGQFGVEGPNLIHKSYFQESKGQMACILTNINNKIGPFCVIEPHCLFFKNVSVEHSVVMKGVCMEENVSVSNSILGDAVFVGSGSKISELCVIGNRVKIAKNSELKGQKLSAVDAK